MTHMYTFPSEVIYFRVIRKSKRIPWPNLIVEVLSVDRLPPLVHFVTITPTVRLYRIVPSSIAIYSVHVKERYITPEQDASSFDELDGFRQTLAKTLFNSRRAKSDKDNVH